MTSPSEDADLFGKVVSDLQEDVVFNSDITGTLKYVTDYTGFSSETELQSGNFIAFHCESDAETITAELIGGVGGPVTLDESGDVVMRVTDKTQKIEVKAGTTTKVFTMSNMTWEVE